MPEITLETVDSRPILAVTRKTSMAGSEIAAAMQADFETLGKFMAANAIHPIGPPVAIYTDMEGGQVTYELGFPVGPEDLRKAQDPVHTLHTPAGKVLKTTHIGSYAQLEKTYDMIEQRIVRDGLRHDGPMWEVYVNDPDTSAESDLLTEIFCRVA
ncbi:MAG TPA: GyrI-like domain-containing protein [Devosiaceae bacterium]